MARNRKHIRGVVKWTNEFFRIKSFITVYGSAAGQRGNFDVEFDRSSNGLQFSATSSWNSRNYEIKFSTDHARRTFTAKLVKWGRTHEINGNFNIVGRKVMLTGE